ncbi:DUF1289 domain-containing protein [Methylocella sp.]|uniref:DUF1289 domain-containing protein n=1 Tax=Methylocella sp. TaxID=1978226 RepID=UPI003782E724
MGVAPRPRPASPCVGACALDEASGLCVGCARTRDEIARWGSADEAFRARVWAELPARAAALGLAARRLDWRGATLLDEVERRFAEAAGTFVVGVYGAVAEVLRDPDEPFEAQREGLALTLRTGRAAMRIEAPDHLAAFELVRPGNAPLIAFAVPESRLGAPGPGALTPLGKDAGALLARDADGVRFDVGLGRSAARFSIRCPAPLAARLAEHVGEAWPDHLDRIRAAMVEESPVRIVETAGLRAEIDAAIPPPGGTSPEGPHTHLLPDHVAQGFDAPPTLPLPKGYAVCAIFYPA